MKKSLGFVIGLFLIFTSTFPLLNIPVLSADVKDTPISEKPVLAEAYRLDLSKSFAHVPIHFIKNIGLTEPEIYYFARGLNYALYLTQAEMLLVLRTRAGDSNPAGHKVKDDARTELEKNALLQLRLIGTAGSPLIVPENQLPGKINYFIGSDSTKWRTNLPAFARVRYENVYPGVDLVIYGNQNLLEYDFVISPGARPDVIRMRFNGMEKLGLDESGRLVASLSGSEIIQKAPIIYQIIDGEKRPVNGGWELLAENEVGFGVTAYDRDYPLIIDPTLEMNYSTYLGGSGGETGQGIMVDSSGNVYVTGQTGSTNFPVQAPFQGSNAGSNDVYVTKLSADGSSLVYSTYLGGTGWEESYSIAVDSSGNAYVTGYTDSTNFPVQTPFQGSNAGGYDAFVSKLSADGSALVYSTYLGGTNSEECYSIAVDSAGSAYVTGTTNSTNFPTQSPYQGSNAGGYDTFVTKLSSAGSSLVYSTYLGGTLNDYGHGIAIDSSGNAYVTGHTISTNFPTQNPYQSSNAGIPDVFVTKFSSPGSPLVYSTYLGGTGGDYGRDIAVDSSGNTYVMGYTDSTNFPTQNPFQNTNAGGNDVFVTKLSSLGSALVYSTYIGGTGTDYAYKLSVDSSGNAYITGETFSADFPVQNAFQGANAGSWDAFVTKLSSPGSALVYSTYLGGTTDDTGRDIVVDSSGNAYVVGETISTDFPVQSAYQGTNAGGYDAFVTKFDAYPPASSPYPPSYNYNALPGTSVYAYRGVSMCFDAPNPSAVAVLGPSIGPYDTTMERIGRWNPGIPGYDEYPNISDLLPGHSFWYLSRFGTPISFSGLKSPTMTAPVSGVPSVRVRINHGWNQVGNPFCYPIDLANVVVTEDDGSGAELMTDGHVTQGLFWIYLGGYGQAYKLDACMGGWIKKITSGDGWIYLPDEQTTYPDQLTADKLIEVAADVERPPAPPGGYVAGAAGGGGGGGGGGCFVKAVE